MPTMKHGPYGTFTDYLTTGLNSLADGARVLGAEIDNTSALDLYYDLQLKVQPASAPALGAPVDVFIIPAIDGTNYAAGDGSTESPQAHFAGAFTALNVNTLHTIALRDVPVPPGKFKLLLRNSMGQAFAASGNVFSYRPHNLQVS